MVRLVLFDIDGTLVLTGGAGQKAFAQVCEEVFGIPDGAANLTFSGRTDPSIVRSFFTLHDIPATPGNFVQFFREYLPRLKVSLCQNEGHVLPGIESWITALKAQPDPPALGLLTGNVREGAALKLRHYALWDHFVTGAFGDDHEDRNEVARVARERGDQLLNSTLSGEEILVIGDTPRDIECARAIGARVLAVATGNYTAADLEPHGADWLVESMETIEPAAVVG